MTTGIKILRYSFYALITIMLFVTLLPIFSRLGKLDYQTHHHIVHEDVQTVKKYFPHLQNMQKTYWSEGLNKTHDFMRSYNYGMEGYIWLSKDEKLIDVKSDAWNNSSIDGSWRPPFKLELVPAQQQVWYLFTGENAKLVTAGYQGEIYGEPNLHLIYFDLVRRRN